MPPLVPVLIGIGSALTGGAATGAAAATIGGMAVAGTASAVAGAATGIVGLATKKDDAQAPTYDAKKEQAKAEEAASAKYRKAAAEQTQTVNTSALGGSGNVNTGKTVLGG